MTQRGRIDATGRWEATSKTKAGRKFPMSGWFKDGRAIGYLRNGNLKDHCDYRFDLAKVD